MQDKDIVELTDYDSELSCDLFDDTQEITLTKDNFKEQANENLLSPFISDRTIEKVKNNLLNLSLD